MAIPAKFIIKETFHCLRLYPSQEEVDLAQSEMDRLIEKGMTHHLMPANHEAEEMMPAFEDLTRGDLRALADERGLNYDGLSTEQIRDLVAPKTGAAAKQKDKELATMTLKELQQLTLEKGIDAVALAKKLEVENPDKITKKQLIEAIQAAE
jgi:hypothetical protein